MSNLINLSIIHQCEVRGGKHLRGHRMSHRLVEITRREKNKISHVSPDEYTGIKNTRLLQFIISLL